MKKLSSQFEVKIEGLDNFDYSGRSTQFSHIRVVLTRDSVIIHDDSYALKQGEKINFDNTFTITLDNE